MIWTDDPVMDAANYEAERERKMQELPICDFCGEHITDDSYHEIRGLNICDRCLEDHRKNTPEV